MRIINDVNYLSTPIISPSERKNYPLTLKIRAIALAIFTLGIFFIGSLIYTACKRKVKVAPEPQLKQTIYDFVEAFLYPYITGQITKENEPAGRKSMMELLLIHLMQQGIPAKNPDINPIAVSCYLLVSLKVIPRRNITKDDPEYAGLLKAIKKSFPKDFPNLKLTSQGLERTLNLIIENKNKHRKDAFNHHLQNLKLPILNC